MKDEIQYTETPKSGVRSPLFLKLVGLSAILMASVIPSCFTSQLIRDRKNYEAVAIESVVGTWASEQELGAIEFATPYHYLVYNESDRKTARVDHQLKTLPSRLRIESSDKIEFRKRGIFEIPIYKANMVITGEFEIPKDLVPGEPDEIQTMLSQNLKLTFNNSAAISEFGLKVNGQPHAVQRTPEGFTMTFSENTFLPGTKLTFEFSAQLNGYKSLAIKTAAADLDVSIQSKWQHPSFSGQLPIDQTVSANGFSARWKILQAQQNQIIAIGFIEPVNVYSQVERALKYSFLITTLVLSALFLIETLWKFRIHPMQYLLMTLPLGAFYIVLLATSEHMGFLGAYAIASAAVIGLLYFYFLGIGATGSQSMTLVLVLATLKTLVYSMLSSEDFALLTGAISLFLVLSAFMMMTRKVDWSTSLTRSIES